MWRKPKPKEMNIQCKKLTNGEVAYGNLIIAGKAKTVFRVIELAAKGEATGKELGGERDLNEWLR
jgi:hypothetical protein